MIETCFQLYFQSFYIHSTDFQKIRSDVPQTFVKLEVCEDNNFRWLASHQVKLFHYLMIGIFSLYKGSLVRALMHVRWFFFKDKNLGNSADDSPKQIPNKRFSSIFISSKMSLAYWQFLKLQMIKPELIS